MVGGVGSGPTPFDIMNSKLIELVSDADFVLGGQIKFFSLGAVAQT